MPDANIIKEHAEIVGSDGVHVGIVDHMDGDRIKLTKQDGEEHHRYLSTAHVADIRGNSVTLTVTAAEAIASESGE